MSETSNSDALRSRAFLAASAALGRAKGRYGRALVHRSLGKLVVNRHRVIQALVLPIGFCCFILYAESALMAFWRNCILYWASRLALPLQANEQGNETGPMALSWSSANTLPDMPGLAIWLTTAMLTIIAFALSSRLDKEKLPLQYLVRILCFIQTLSLLFFLILPSQFPYNVSGHIADIVHVGYVLMFVTPIMLAMGYYLLNVSPVIKMVHTVLILGYFVVMIPHQIVLHALILHHFSLLFMPILYICFGAVFDVLIFVALYSWAASTLPARATG